jgi:hypothetical protein
LFEIKPALPQLANTAAQPGDHFSLTYHTKITSMRLLLFLYVVVFLTLNFLVEGDLILLMAMSTFPVSLYLIIRKPRSKRKYNHEQVRSTGSISAQKEESLKS